METTSPSRSTFESLPWALLLIWWGILELVPARPQGIAALGVAAILLGVNVLRIATGSVINHFSVAIGMAALVAGGLMLAQSVLHLSFHMPIFPVLLIVCGVVILAGDILKAGVERSAYGENASHEDPS